MSVQKSHQEKREKILKADQERRAELEREKARAIEREEKRLREQNQRYSTQQASARPRNTKIQGTSKFQIVRKDRGHNVDQIVGGSVSIGLNQSSSLSATSHDKRQIQNGDLVR